MDDFKLPQTIPQDLLLIRNLIGVPSDAPQLNPTIPKVVQTADSIDSSDSEIASEDEIEAELALSNSEEELRGTNAIPLSPDSDSDSESESESSVNDDDAKSVSNHCLEEDDESGPAQTTGVHFRTKNEIDETDITIPDIAEVGPDEVLEKVGEIMSVMEKLVIVKGVPSERVNQGSERALDSDTLLVFGDRKVMGYVYETFGPTSQPMYQVKFTEANPLDPEQMRIARDVFHVPQRSHFIFLNQIKQMKGSDASNVHDEEPAEHELEFSDDEAEAAFKSSLKRKRSNSRAQSVASSRQSSPTPSQMRDQDLVDDVILKGNAYDEHGPYDLDFSAGPSRPLPIPYDDPYGDDYSPRSSDIPMSSGLTTASGLSTSRGEHQTSIHGTWHGRGNLGHNRDRGRGRGRGRGGRVEGSQRRADTARNPRQNSSASDPSWDGRPITRSRSTTPYDSHIPRPLSPTSLAIAHATGQMPVGSNVYMPHNQVNNEAWGYQDPRFQQQAPVHFNTQSYSPPFVQPHINPRFASAFGLHMNMHMGLMQPQQYDQYEGSNMHSVSSPQTSDWAEEWAVPTVIPDERGAGEDTI